MGHPESRVTHTVLYVDLGQFVDRELYDPETDHRVLPGNALLVPPIRDRSLAG